MTKGPIKEVTDTYSGERREEYARMLEELAGELRARNDFPEGIFVAVSWRDGDVGKRYECEPSFSALKLVGVFELLKLELLDDITGFSD